MTVPRVPVASASVQSGHAKICPVAIGVSGKCRCFPDFVNPLGSEESEGYRELAAHVESLYKQLASRSPEEAATPPSEMFRKLETFEHSICSLLLPFAGETGEAEGAADVLKRKLEELAKLKAPAAPISEPEAELERLLDVVEVAVYPPRVVEARQKIRALFAASRSPQQGVTPSFTPTIDDLRAVSYVLMNGLDTRYQNAQTAKHQLKDLRTRISASLRDNQGTETALTREEALHLLDDADGNNNLPHSPDVRECYYCFDIAAKLKRIAAASTTNSEEPK